MTLSLLRTYTATVHSAQHRFCALPHDVCDIITKHVHRDVMFTQGLYDDETIDDCDMPITLLSKLNGEWCETVGNMELVVAAFGCKIIAETVDELMQRYKIIDIIEGTRTTIDISGCAVVTPTCQEITHVHRNSWIVALDETVLWCDEARPSVALTFPHRIQRMDVANRHRDSFVYTVDEQTQTSVAAVYDLRAQNSVNLGCQIYNPRRMVSCDPVLYCLEKDFVRVIDVRMPNYDVRQFVRKAEFILPHGDGALVGTLKVADDEADTMSAWLACDLRCDLTPLSWTPPTNDILRAHLLGTY